MAAYLGWSVTVDDDRKCVIGHVPHSDLRPLELEDNLVCGTDSVDYVLSSAAADPRQIMVQTTDILGGQNPDLDTRIRHRTTRS